MASRFYVPARYALAVMLLLGFANVYALRVNLSVAMVKMKKEFDWDPTTSGIILGSFFYGYIVTQIPGGMLSAKYGAKWVFGLGCLCTTVLTLLTPIAAYQSTWLLIVVRILEGLGEGVTYPAVHAMWGKWAPPLERSKLTTIGYTGASIGTVLAMPISGILCDVGFKSPPAWSRWPSVFYVFGTLGLIWCILWFALVHSSPRNHPRISAEERDYIESSIRDEEIRKQSETSDDVSVPVYQILTSPAVWAIIVSYFCNNWGFYTLLTDIPSFLKSVLGFHITNNGILSAVPYALLAFVIPLTGWVADTLRERHILSTTATRKLMNSLGQFLPAVFLVAICYTTNRTIIIVCLCLSVGIGGMQMSGSSVNHLDIAPRYAGLLMGISNGAGTIPGIIAPYVAGAMTPAPSGSHQLQLEWRNVFYLAAEIYVFGAIVFLILASGNLQWWAGGIKKLKDDERRPILA
ncbi:sialin-like [Oscarella lobularis]|uniref:sialin-like n=1 Tax=Oscarella lobularis TaxID=121494 RepID=UPI003313B476